MPFGSDVSVTWTVRQYPGDLQYTATHPIVLLFCGRGRVVGVAGDVRRTLQAEAEECSHDVGRILNRGGVGDGAGRVVDDGRHFIVRAWQHDGRSE